MVQDADSEFIVRIHPTPGNILHGEFPPTLAQPQVREMTAERLMTESQLLSSGSARRCSRSIPECASARKRLFANKFIKL